jgi:hypothetical protein
MPCNCIITKCQNLKVKNRPKQLLGFLPLAFTLPRINVIKHFTVVIYCHSMVILSSCVIKLHYLGNYCGLAVNYDGICETNVIKQNLTYSESILNLEKLGFYYCGNLPRYLFYNIGLWIGL